jgi:hypothetical protein
MRAVAAFKQRLGSRRWPASRFLSCMLDSPSLKINFTFSRKRGDRAQIATPGEAFGRAVRQHFTQTGCSAGERFPECGRSDFRWPTRAWGLVPAG